MLDNYKELKRQYWIENILVKLLIQWFLSTWLIKWTNFDDVVNNILTTNFNDEIILIKRNDNFEFRLYAYQAQQELRKLVDPDYSILMDNNAEPFSFIKNMQELYFDKLTDSFLKQPIVTRETMSLLNSFKNNLSFIVGGFVRDALSWRIAKDVDFVTDIPIDQLKTVFINNWFEIKEIGEHFGVLMVMKNNEKFEIALFRKDLYNEGVNWRGASDIDIWNIEDDFKRRDFTINSLYYNPFQDVLLDPNEWFLDLINNQFRFIWNPEDRIKEDVLRILRVYKFMKKWFTPTKETLGSIRQKFWLLCEMWNPERIRTEIEKLIF